MSSQDRLALNSDCYSIYSFVGFLRIVAIYPTECASCCYILIIIITVVYIFIINKSTPSVISTLNPSIQYILNEFGICILISLFNGYLNQLDRYLYYWCYFALVAFNTCKSVMAYATCYLRVGTVMYI